MKIHLCIILLVTTLLSSCRSGDRSLGHGYRLVPRTVDLSRVPNAFEGKAHYTDLYYGSHCLGTVEAYSISPSGRFALFDDNGKVILFDSHSNLPQDVTDGAFAIPKTFTWDEKAGTVDINYYGNHWPSRIRIRK